MSLNAVRITLAVVLHSAVGAAVAQGQTPFDSTAASVSMVPAGVPTVVTVTALVTDTKVIPSSLQLQRANATGSPTVVGTLRDDGLLGDAVDGDRVFSLTFTISETVPKVLAFRISAAFSGVIRRVVSDPFEIVVRGNQSPEAMVAQLASKLRLGDVPSILSHFAPSAATERVLTGLDQVGRDKLATAFENMRLTRATGDARFYDVPWVDEDGTNLILHVILAQGGTGQWVVISW
jgi:hypothetical protein